MVLEEDVGGALRELVEVLVCAFEVVVVLVLVFEVEVLLLLDCNHFLCVLVRVVLYHQIGSNCRKA